MQVVFETFSSELAELSLDEISVSLKLMILVGSEIGGSVQHKQILVPGKL
jgi:hypothetical protein